MKKVFVDANVFLRFFTRDDAGQHGRAERLFRSAAGGEVALITGPPVLFEVAWTMRAAYKTEAAQILDMLESIIALPGMTLTDKAICAEALRLARSGDVEFPDAYIAALADECGAETVATFNLADFKKLGVRCCPL
jgi:predicted nucleic acid-binding protein